MKTIKHFSMLLAMIAVAFSLNSCLFAGSLDKIGVSELKDNGSMLTYTENDAIIVTTFYYGYKGEAITSHKEEIKFGNSILASAYKQELEEDEYDNDLYEKISVSGKVVTVVYNPKEFEGLTVEEVKENYNLKKETYDQMNED